MSAFWDGFWSVFRHLFVIYMLGVTAGFWIWRRCCGLDGEMLKRIIAAISAGAFICAMAWLGGFDFDTRGSTAMLVFFVGGVSSVFAYLLAGLDW